MNMNEEQLGVLGILLIIAVGFVFMVSGAVTMFQGV